MAGRRDLLEAASFERRRLASALVSGRRAVEPGRPGRLVVAGVVLAALVVTGGAVAGLVAPRAAVDWTRPGVVVSRETGAAYAVLGSGPRVLHPLANATSARLVLGPAASATVLPQEVLARQRVGAEVGVPGAPARLPDPGSLLATGWTACTADGAGVRLRIGGPGGVAPEPLAGLVVHSEGGYHLVATAASSGGEPAGARRYALPPARGSGADDQDNLLAGLGVGIRASAPEVPSSWLELLPVGGRLDLGGLRLRGRGRPPTYADAPGLPPGARVGDVLSAPDGSVLLTRTGPARLDPFALAVHRSAAGLAGGSRELVVPDLPPVAQVRPPWEASHWPDHRLAPLRGEACAALAPPPQGPAAPAAPVVALATGPAPEAAASGLAPERVSVSVEEGHGALVRVVGGRGERLLVDARGTAYPLVGPEAVERLGYAGHPPSPVPAGWAALLRPGVRLVVQDAGAGAR